MIIQENKEELLAEFYEKYVANRWINDFLKIDEIYKSDNYVIDANLVSAFNEVCKQALDLQEKQLKGEIRYIYFSLLRTSILENKGEYRIDLYDENWFLDKQECFINIDLNFIFTSIFKYMEELKEKKKECGRSITDMDIESIFFLEIDKYHVLAVEFLKGIIEKFIGTPSHEKMKKAEDIRIFVGEYMDETEMIYPEEK
ncbi:hypothetical protein LGL08_23305 [Clostridium estertheticum]|uniref:hypothetical protein n=1 Tax=Clostridium estertheticum TaxID=238834 RepID=UPI001CF556A0|nr:hypothetical protein [Clostridium estertheticum]MCB2309473.1 hypothetical protein [Clostridium estertheticum]MCB2347925.1 hypothetical protein [Clostridium estertheticum]MCB2352428.1 hypothetical protein [Clostridium estertheticum]WAG45300.1 hypothetical protein LL127_17500 [Clostridium estertheticum]